MNITIKTIAALSLLLPTAVPVSAEVAENVALEVRRAAGHTRFLNVVVKGDTVVLSGFVEDSYARAQAERAAKKAGAERVINRLFTR